MFLVFFCSSNLKVFVNLFAFLLKDTCLWADCYNLGQICPFFYFCYNLLGRSSDEGIEMMSEEKTGSQNLRSEEGLKRSEKGEVWRGSEEVWRGSEEKAGSQD